MITTGPPEEIGNFAAPLPASLDEDSDTIQPASDSPETALTSANRVKKYLPKAVMYYILGISSLD
jgi:hypothetical protein